MARKIVERLLPPLAELFPDFQGFPESGHRLHLATKILSAAAHRLQEKVNRPFYSMREVARFLTLSLDTLAMVYHELENKGLIVRIRGSHTILLGKDTQTRHPARGIVSVPLPLLTVETSPFVHNFCHHLSEELWRYHFVANLIPCTPSEVESLRFRERLSAQSDSVVWINPEIALKETILTLRDHGLRNILLSPWEAVSMPDNYIMDWVPAWRDVFGSWRADGIRHVVVSKALHPVSQKATDSFLGALQDEGFAITLAEPDAVDLCGKVAQCLKREIRVACAVPQYENTSYFCNHDPVLMAQLTTHCRVLFGRGVVSAPYFLHRPYRADVIGFSGEQVAKRVALDLGRRAQPKEQSVRLSPQWIPNADLSVVFGKCSV